jgi:hypothetical protein
MDINYVAILIVGLATLFVGYFVGLVESRGQKDKKNAKEEPIEKRFEPPVMAAHVPVAPKENNLLKLSLDNNNQPRLELDGQRADASQLAPGQRKRLIDLMVMMRPWIDASAPKPSAPPQPVLSPTPPSTAIAANISQPVSTPIPAPFSMSNISKAIAPVLIPPAKKEEAPTSMVGQIDAILQIHLANSPLANRAIRLMESPEGGVVVIVGLTKYNSVGDVSDPQVQAMIRAAIAEWEKKYTPGI